MYCFPLPPASPFHVASSLLSLFDANLTFPVLYSFYSIFLHIFKRSNAVKSFIFCLIEIFLIFVLCLMKNTILDCLNVFQGGDFYPIKDDELWNYYRYLWIFVLSSVASFFPKLLNFIISKYMASRQKSANSLLTKSVKAPPTLTANQCVVPPGVISVLNTALALSSVDSHWPVPLKCFLQLQLRFGLRVSECLNITSGDLLQNNNILIRGLKRSNDRIINYDDPFSYLTFCKQHSINPFADFDRFYIYRLYKANGLQLYLSSSSKFAVTHSLRHALAKSLESQAIDVLNIGSLLGHKSKRSTDYYTNKK